MTTAGAPKGSDDGARALLERVGGEVLEGFARNQRVMSFDEFVALFTARPAQYARSAPQYLRDVFDHFGTTQIKSPHGTSTRWKLFDVEWLGGRDRLVGQEDVQARVYRVLSNFVREGRTNKLILLHGPNGSAKSTFVSCLARGLEHYSSLDEGALYRFHWIFPSQKLHKGGIGFGGGAADSPSSESFAYLPDELIDAKLSDELRDNPLLLLPPRTRQEILAQVSGFKASDHILYGDLSHKNKQIFEALLVAYQGDYLKVMRHVQVERFYVSRRYRHAAVTIEPQLAVDAHARQLTMDRSLAALPPALQSLSLFEYSGELVDANRGLIDFADLLKRPLEHYKYLLGTVENSRVPVENSFLYLDTVFIGSSNESHLAVFKEVPEFQSFKGRLELIRVPYLLDYTVEETIYREQIKPSAIGKHVAPHTAEVAALWAVLTRIRKPLAEKYGKPLSDLVARLGPLDKADLYARGTAPEAMSTEHARELCANIDRVWSESDSYPNYEGRTGASPREVKTLILNAAENPRFACVSPLAVFDEMEEIVKNVTVYEFLKQEPLPGGFHENKRFIQTVRERYLDDVDEELRSSMGLVDERKYAELMSRYVANVMHWVKHEKIRNVVTGRLEDPDNDLMLEMEKIFGLNTSKLSEDFRRDAIARIGAWSIDNPHRMPDYAQVFPRQYQTLREAYYEQRKKTLFKGAADLVEFLAEGRLPSSADKDAEERVSTTLTNLRETYGYCDKCAREAVTLLVKKRYT